MDRTPGRRRAERRKIDKKNESSIMDDQIPFTPATELLKFAWPRAEHGDTWGNWYLDKHSMCLVYKEKGPGGYWIDLDDCDTSAQILDWICQLAHKRWITPTDLANLVYALDDLLHPQANICSWGSEHGPIDPAKTIQQGYSARLDD